MLTTLPEIGHSVRVKGLSRKGKQMIQQYGNEWAVIACHTVACFDGREGIAVKCFDVIRWIETTRQDRDFEIVEIVD